MSVQVKSSACNFWESISEKQGGFFINNDIAKVKSKKYSYIALAQINKYI